MKSSHFDVITRALANSTLPRRTLLQGVVGGLVASAASRWGGSQAAPAAIPALQTNTDMTTASMPVCNAEHNRRWLFVRDHLMGVAVHDPFGHNISIIPADDALHGWRPFDGAKQSLCGKLHHFNFYNPWHSGDEADWNNYIIPNAKFQYLIDDARPLAGSSVHDCSPGSNNCMEAEVTPDDHFYRTWAFDSEEEDSAFEGGQICTYGPWVGDGGHDFRPEIHPSEMYWHRSGDETGTTNMIVVQDDSNRFDRRGDYDGFPPSGWRPWSATPRGAVFRVAVHLDTAASLRTYEVTEEYKRNIVTSRPEFADRAKDTDDGNRHVLVYNGKRLLQIWEKGTGTDLDLGVQFFAFCRNASNTRLSGYMQLSVVMGKNQDEDGDRGQEGYYHFKIRQTSGPAAPARLPGDEFAPISSDEALVTPAPGADDLVPLTLRTPLMQIRDLPDTMRRETINGQQQLVADADLEIIFGGDETAATAPSVTSIIVRPDDDTAAAAETPLELTFVPMPSEATAAATGPAPITGRILSVPLGATSPLEVSLSTGETRRIAQPGVFLAPEIRMEQPRDGQPDEGAWDAFVSAAGAVPQPSATPLPLQHVRRWRIETQPLYVPQRAGDLSREDETPFTEALNGAILGEAFEEDEMETGEADRIEELFGSSDPYAVSWTFTARNLTTGETGEDVLTRIQVTPVPASVPETDITIPDGGLEVVFPNDGGFYELVATATMTDGLVPAGQVQHRVWSHVLASTDANSLVEQTLGTVAQLAGLPSNNDLAAMSSLETVAPIADATSILESGEQDSFLDAYAMVEGDPQSRRARSLRVFATQAAVDGRITVEEFGILVRAAKQFWGT